MRYEKPEIDIELFNKEDVIYTSGLDGNLSGDDGGGFV